MSGLICAGNVFLNRYVSGVLTGEHGPINATKFAINPGSADKLDRPSFMRDTYGQALDSVVFPGIASLSIETDDAAAEVLQYALLGTLSDVTASSGTATSEAITAHSDRWTKLAHRSVSNVVVKNATDVTTYTVTTDYVVDAVSGMIKTVKTGSIADLDTLHVSYSYGTLTSKQIIAATNTEVRAYVRLEGKNLANQKYVSITVPEAVLTPSGELDIAGKAFIKFGLSGSIVTQTGQSGPFIYTEIS